MAEQGCDGDGAGQGKEIQVPIDGAIGQALDAGTPGHRTQPRRGCFI